VIIYAHGTRKEGGLGWEAPRGTPRTLARALGPVHKLGKVLVAWISAAECLSNEQGVWDSQAM